MALCEGERKPSGLKCYGTVWKCKACGSTGCMQNKEELCSHQGFNALQRCLKCGAVGQMEMLPNEERAPRKTGTTG